MSDALSHITRLGRYQVLRELGRGGMSVVYLARDSELERDVAIKCVDTSKPATARLVQRLRAEAKLLAQLNSPHIVQLYDVVEQDSMLGLVIEFVGGHTLTQRLQQAPSRAVVLRWLAEVADGLANAHQQGIAHCDLKGDNVLITQHNVAKIADFGIARVKLDDYLAEDGAVRSGSVSGSYFSLSPEQATGQPVDTRSDLFSLAVLIYQALVGRHPFGETANKAALLERIVSSPFTLASDAQSVLGLRLGEVVSNLLSKAPADRLYTASEVAEFLRNAQQPEGQQADDTTQLIPLQPTPSAAPRWKAWLSRGALLAAGFVVGMGIIKYSPLFSGANDTVHFVALDTIEITTDPEFNDELMPLIQSTLQTTAEQAVLSLQDTGLISSREFDAVEGDYRQRATATGATSILNLLADCGRNKCDLKLRKYDGPQMAVTEQRSWPVAVQNLTDIRNTLRAELLALYPAAAQGDSEMAVSEDIYRTYLDVFLDSENGKQAKPEHLITLDKLIARQPFFIPAYDLARRVSQRLNTVTGDGVHLTRLERILAYAPDALNEDPSILAAKIYVKLQQERHDEAEELFAFAQQVVKDKSALINLETDLAYYGNQPQRLLELDRKNSVLRPSAKTFYNLATSEYSFGNYTASMAAVDRALELNSDYSFALSLRGTVAMRQGDLVSAIRDFNQALKSNQSGSNYSNLGVALMLSSDYQGAIDNFKRALEISDQNTTYLLNIADAHKLNQELDLAAQYYDAVIDLTSPPATIKQFRDRAQAFAQNGNHSEAIKTLNAATKKFPDQSDFEYAAAIVYTMSDNQIAAAVAVEEALETGVGKVWFTFPWFKKLCVNESFRRLTQPETEGLCAD
ncbi:hypothetical protein GCM10008090_01340 [Arenicella chitinivorans]|uniref:Protein kinase domain-containing protein n=1 Tax=Arenicella chitinivorans TaxID=1329800 RepID=A0A918RFF5_9GAMM|nr:serine/threonine-protein kinase [Arenicella chitinivorans]GGZ96831.1 hypothetical protein GCM10008090_01340 [Arenicella chitinivorans]